MAKLVFRENKTQRMGKGEVLQRTSFPNREESIFRQTLRICKAASEAGLQPMVVGGVAFRFYADSDFKCKTAGITTTDVDIVVKEMPDEIRDKAGKRKMLDASQMKMGSLGTETKITKKLSDMEVYYFPESSGMGALEDVDIFLGNIGRIIVTKRDFEDARTVNIGNDEDIRVRLPHPGFLIATMMNPEASKETRTRRTVYILASLQEEIGEIASKFVEVMRRSYHFEDPKHEESMFQKIFNQLDNFAGKARGAIGEFKTKVRNELEKAKNSM